MKNEEDYVKTLDEMRQRATSAYGAIHLKDRGVYCWLKEQAGLNRQCNLNHDEREERLENILKLLELTREEIGEC
jgi:hypothetical protein